jgi:hypothetical protein
MAAKLFFSYSHADEDLRDQLEKQLSMLIRQGVIEPWHDRRITAGDDFAGAIDSNLEDADIVLLLVSADFLASAYCYDREMARALERHEEGSARVIPVILRPCDWTSAPFGKLQALPKNATAVTRWPDRDEALLDVVQGIRKAAESRVRPVPAAERRPTPTTHDARVRSDVPVRSSNLRLRKEFSERDRDRFLQETFEFMARFFENSLAELAARNADIEIGFRQVDANRFTAAIYKNGKAEARCTIFMGSSFGGGIAFRHGETMENNSINESLNVEADDQAMYLRALGMARHGGERDAKLSQEGAAEYYWSLLVGNLQ